MKSSLALMFLVFFLTTMYFFAEGTSPRKCEDKCNLENCFKEGECKCGTFKDECNCCSRCYRCKGEECFIIQQDQCEGDLKCKHSDDADYLQIMNFPGTCA